jgi:polyribonucleotide nucleotidyltransferase
MADTNLDLVVAGTATAVLMVESEAKELNEDIMLGAVMFGHKHFQPVIKAIIELAEKAAKEPRDVVATVNEALEKEMLGIVEQDLRKAYSIPVKQDRYAAVGAVKQKVLDQFFQEGVEPRFEKLRVLDVQGSRSQDRALEHSGHRQAHRRPRPEHGSSDRRRSRRAAARSRFGAVHPR